MESTLMLTETVANGTAVYGSGDIVGGITEFDNAYSQNNGSFLNWVRLIDEEKLNQTYRLYLFGKKPSTPTTDYNDNSSFAANITATDFVNCFARIEIPAANYESFTAFSSVWVTQIDGVALHNINRICAILVVDGTPDFLDANKLRLTLGLFAGQ